MADSAGTADSAAPPSAEPIAGALLRWWDMARRDLPWRAPPGQRAEPYHVWLSEIMLQQTTVKAVIPYYAHFLRRWPDLRALAAAPLEEVMQAWAGLGYYSRARNLHACARAIAAAHGGKLPASEAALRRLPGIGVYTAAAIAAIAFDQPAAAVDGNVERVAARLFAIQSPLPAAKPELRRLAAALTPPRRPGDFAQAMMDLGAMICTPRSPACPACPLLPHCLAGRRGIAAKFPYRAAKAAKPVRRGIAFVALREDQSVLLRQRLPEGLLGGMLEAPSTGWQAAMPAQIEALALAPLEAAWRRIAGVVTHTFTHFHLELEVYRAEAARGAKLRPEASPERCRWTAVAELKAQALPSVMRKVLAHALAPVS